MQQEAVMVCTHARMHACVHECMQARVRTHACEHPLRPLTEFVQSSQWCNVWHPSCFTTKLVLFCIVHGRPPACSHPHTHTPAHPHACMYMQWCFALAAATRQLGLQQHGAALAADITRGAGAPASGSGGGGDRGPPAGTVTAVTLLRQVGRVFKGCQVCVCVRARARACTRAALAVDLVRGASAPACPSWEVAGGWETWTQCHSSYTASAGGCK